MPSPPAFAGGGGGGGGVGCSSRGSNGGVAVCPPHVLRGLQ